MPKEKTEKKFRNHKQNTNSAPQSKQGIRFNKDFGQHILKNPLIITSMIEKVFSSLNFNFSVIKNQKFNKIYGPP